MKLLFKSGIRLWTLILRVAFTRRPFSIFRDLYVRTSRVREPPIIECWNKIGPNEVEKIVRIHITDCN